MLEDSKANQTQEPCYQASNDGSSDACNQNLVFELSMGDGSDSNCPVEEDDANAKNGGDKSSATTSTSTTNNTDEEMALSSSSSPQDVSSSKNTMTSSSPTAVAAVGSAESSSSSSSRGATVASTNNATTTLLLQPEMIVETETKVVYWLKFCVLFVLAIAAIIIAMAYYIHASQFEMTKFEERFDNDAHKVLDSLGFSLDLTLSAVDSFVVSMVSFAKYSNMTWPFVTLPNYAVRVAKIRTLSKAFIVGQYQLVQPHEKEEWELYASQNDGWVQEGLDVQRNDPTYHGKKPETYNTSYHIFDPSYEDIQEDDPSRLFYLPNWQGGPIVPIKYPYNWNAAKKGHIASVLPELIENKRVVISGITNFGDNNNSNKAWSKNFVGEDEDPNNPSINIFYPIIDTAADEVCAVDHDDALDDNNNNTSASPSSAAAHVTSQGNVVGIVRIGIYWRDLIREIGLVGGVNAVFSNTCNQTFTYEINNNGQQNVKYLGIGDLHNQKYNHMEKVSSIVDLGIDSKFDDAHTHRPKAYTGVPLSSTAGCQYTLRVYPTAALEDEYLSSEPIRTTAVIIFIFVFTSCVFLIYDWCVERRQQKVMHTAVESTANVSLLEDMVKERTKSLEETNRQLEEANKRVLQASQQQLLHFSCCSHEIRTPLNCIIGLSSLLHDTELNPMQKECMQMIVSSGDLLLTVVNDVLDYSRLESGNVETVIRPSSLQELLNSVVHSIEARGRSKNLSVRTYYDPALPELLTTDSRRLQQILFNILGNAVKFSNDHGVIELGISLYSPTDRNGTVTETALASSPSFSNEEDVVLRFTIKDYGKGIKEEDYEKIFKPFLQANAYTEHQHGGTGLGLAITAKLVKRLGGTISVESKRWNWSKFTIDFPFKDSHVDIMGISERFQNTTIFLVAIDDQSQTISSFKTYKADLVKFRSLDELHEHVSTMEPKTSSSSERRYVCLVHEDLYKAQTYDSISSKLNRSVLFSFGPTYSVKEARGHVRSLGQMLPSVLMERLGSCVDALGHDHATSQDPKESKSEASQKAVPYTQFRILVAEDNMINQKVLSRILKRLGIDNVEMVGDGKQAVEREASQPYDIVLMDMDMPVMNGIEACKLISKRKGGHPKAKVVFVTAHVADEFKSECLEAGGVEFLPKPFSMDGMENCFRRVHAMCY